MIKLRDVSYYNNDKRFKFKLGDDEITGVSDLERNNKPVYIKLAKYYGLSGYSKFKKDDLIQFIVDECGYELINELTETIGNLQVSRTNPIHELKNKLLGLTDELEIDRIQGSYIYRIWLWVNHNRTFEEEMERIN